MFGDKLTNKEKYHFGIKKTPVDTTNNSDTYADSKKEDRLNLLPTDFKKEANNYSLAKEWMQMYKKSHSYCRDNANRIQENLELHSGRWKKMNNINPNITLQLGHERVTLGSGTLRHFGIIDRVTKDIESDILMRPLILVVKDHSSRGRNFRERARLERVKNYFNKNVIQPRAEEIRRQWDVKNGFLDPNQIPPEQVKQREEEVQSRLKQDTPEEIFHYMSKYNTPDEIVAHSLTKYTLDNVNAKEKFDLGGSMAIASGSSYYRVGIVNKVPHLEVLNPKYVTVIKSKHSDNAEDGVMAMYEGGLTPEEFIAKYGLDLDYKQIKKIAKSYGRTPQAGLLKTKEDLDHEFQNGIKSKLLDHLDNNKELRIGLDPRSQDGQNKLQYLYKQINYGGANSGGYIPETYITWRWGRPITLVYRKLPNGQYDCVVRGQHYVFNPAKGDIRVEKRVVDQTYEGTMIGEEYTVNVGPIAHQYNDINKPYTPKLGIYGGEDNTYLGNIKNSSIIDLGKPFQYMYNVVMKRMDDAMATDIGTVLLGTTTMIPKGWSLTDFYKSIFDGKLALVNHHKDGMNNFDLGAIKTLDMSRRNDIIGFLDSGRFFEEKVYSSMYFSKNKVGDISPYATNQNIQQAVAGSNRQMYKFHNRRRVIKQNVLNALMHLSLIAYRDNEQVKSTILDDFSRQHYELNFNDILTSNFHLSVVDDFKESEKLERMRDLSLTLLQNGLTGREISAIINAESLQEIEDILERGDKRREEARVEQQKHETNLEQIKLQNAESQLKLREQYLSARDERNNEVKLAMAELNSMQIERAQDIDENKIPDSLQRTQAEIEYKDRHDDKMIALEKYKFNKSPSK